MSIAEKNCRRYFLIVWIAFSKIFEKKWEAMWSMYFNSTFQVVKVYEDNLQFSHSRRKTIKFARRRKVLEVVRMEEVRIRCDSK